MASNAGNYWYAIRTAPGAQRMASRIEGLPASRHGESVVERNLRNKGIDVYMPAYWVEVIHHRKKIYIEKRFPLLVGYAFVNLPTVNFGGDFEKVRKVDGVMCLLKINRDMGPIRFHESAISALAAADFEQRQAYLYEQHCRREDERQGRVKELRKTLKTILPKGRAVRVSMVDQAEKILATLSDKTRVKVLEVLGELKSLTGEDGLANFTRVA